MVAGRTYYPEENPALPGRRSRLMVRRGFPRPADRQRRSFRPQRHLGGASDAAVAELRAGDQSLQRPLAHRARQRSRAVSQQPHHRPVQRRRRTSSASTQRGTAWVRVEYVGRAPIEGLRRPDPRGDVAPGRAGAGAGQRQTRRSAHRAGGLYDGVDRRNPRASPAPPPSDACPTGGADPCPMRRNRPAATAPISSSTAAGSTDRARALDLRAGATWPTARATCAREVARASTAPHMEAGCCLRCIG